MPRSLQIVFFHWYIIQTTSQTVVFLYRLWKYEGLKIMLATKFNKLPCLLHVMQRFPIVLLILPQQFYISVPGSVLTHSLLQLPDKAFLTSQTEQGGKNAIPWFPPFTVVSRMWCPQVLCSLSKDLHRDFKLRNQPNPDLQSLCPWSILAINAVRCREFLYVTWEREYGVCHLSESPDCWVYIRVQSDLMDCHFLAAQLHGYIQKSVQSMCCPAAQNRNLKCCPSLKWDICKVLIVFLKFSVNCWPAKPSKVFQV